MARHRKRQAPRWKRVCQNSPLLHLPGEIRTLIYRAALVSPNPIDLWPHKFLEKPEGNTALALRIAKLQKKGKVSGTDVPTFRQQDDLQYVRKEMAIGLLVACKQVGQEAALLFWQDNTFRFSGDFDWHGIRRFLATIGPRAISRIRTLEVFIPLNNMPWKNDKEMTADEYGRSCDASNAPKLHMAKVYQKGDRPWSVNIMDVRLLLIEANSSLNLRFIIPREFVLLREALDPDCCIFELIEDLQDRAPATKLSVIIETGAILEGVDTPEILVSSGLDVVCMPGSFWDKNMIISQNLESKQFSGEQFEYLSGMKRLFMEEERIGVPALGGRATAGPGYRLQRVLKGFGGNKFRKGYAYFCDHCGFMSAYHKFYYSVELMNCRGCLSWGWHTRQDVLLVDEAENVDSNDAK
ncbi:hypothetical protein N431DRAFT_414926 [Stipitochalara longipes BDJ]|nr:hypothetical protein N431DRAFT_414926 [Stipitochalara longipes BDJ]